MLIERCLNALYRTKLYDIYLGRRLPPPISSPAFDHTLSAQALWYAEGATQSHSHLEAARDGHFRTLPIMTSDISEANRTLAAWFTSHDRFDLETWRADIASERVTRWINAYPLISPDMSIQMSALWRMQINRHIRHLNGIPKSAITGWRRFLYHQMRVATALVVEGAKPRLQDFLNALGEDVDQQIWPDGGHISRSPSIALAILALLIEIRDALISKEIEPPGGLITAIDRMVPWIKGMRHSDGGFALMNGATSSTGDLIDTVLAASGSRARAMSDAPHSGFYRLRSGQTIILFDSGQSGSDTHNQRAPASFEMSVGKQRIFSNCGTRLGNDSGADTWREVLRATAAHSTLVVDDKNVGPVNHVRTDRRDHDGARLIENAHDGYQSVFGIEHRRSVYLDAAGTDIRGEDLLSGGQSKAFLIRFHLHPGVNASMVEGGGEVIIKPSKGRGWRFQSDHPIMIDEGVNFYDGRQHRTQQIVILGNHEPTQSTVKWRLTSAV
jgi:uncharacterized heparinase superfamily protein